jgi:hypothetical protein
MPDGSLIAKAIDVDLSQFRPALLMTIWTMTERPTLSAVVIQTALSSTV